ncbi:hypothetical protein Thiowin_01753 [Thiorhodovibrio winogradskyi]|uniref:Uncharacterized protein n=1 Tax=Thiorhodovibrio winogradskyi TaxID=77007 RepID=A0ABZ0S8D6_9GAMM|nr:hypothetical protein [Thiorhodovibrio winogradskyi]
MRNFDHNGQAEASRLRPAMFILIAVLFMTINFTLAAASETNAVDGQESASFPLPPEYLIDQKGFVKLRICFNWSCSSRRRLNFTSADMALLKQRMAICSGASLYHRLQQVRIGIWQMELLARKYQPLLANDLAINDFEAGIKGRMDCVDNSSNTTTYLKILQDIGELNGWSVSAPEVRNRFDVTGVHWTAVIIDTETGLSWSVDSWFRPNGHLPMVMPLQSWLAGKKAWEPPFRDLNATPHSIHELCHTQQFDASETESLLAQ